MAVNRETASLGVPWEKDYGYAQAVKVGDTIYLSGQVSHDDNGTIIGSGDMEAQMRQTYVNIRKVLAQFGATLDNVVDEVTFVTDIEAAMVAAAKVRPEVYPGRPAVTSTLIQIPRLAFPELMIEVKCVARL
ncbi:MAG: Rid family hydrolase [Candidatus Binatia bacterium]